ncbi:MAG: hypothetical protein HFI29_11040 [Lachnospiraceae bacterium]|jgi:hypothetical protein|nr:hypothetical protein [Lachnospiraceae bacterium]
MKVKQLKCSKLGEAFIVFLVFFILLSAFWKDAYFVSDEEEIFVKGQQIAQGLFLYKDIACQHMPVMYFFAAFFSLIGISTITGFRLCFYLLMALVWAVMYYTYRDYFGKKLMLGYPLIYLGAVASMSNGTCILSEQFQGQAMVILMLELLRFSEKLTIKFKNCCMISLAIMISFGTAFVSIFAIFFVGITVLLIEVQYCRKNNIKLGEGIWYLLKKYGVLIVTVLIPWIIILGYFEYTHTLRSFYSWAFEVNRQVYPKYTTGYGGGILGGLFGGVSNIGESIDLREAFTFQEIREFIIVLMSCLSLLKIYKKSKNKLLVLGIALLLIGASTRGAFNNFHGLPACAVMSALAAIFIIEVYPEIPNTAVWKTAEIICIMIFFSGYLSVSGNIFSITTDRIAESTYEAYYQRKLEDIIDNIAEDGERVGFSILNYDILMNSHVTPASVTGGSCPWLWEWGGEQAMRELSNHPPRIFLYNPELSTWGYPIKEYAEDLEDFITDYYIRITEVPGVSILYVRKDVYADIYSLIDDTYIFRSVEFDAVPLTIKDGEIIKQTFVASTNAIMNGLYAKIEAYAGQNNCSLQVVLRDETCLEEISNNIVDCATITDGLFIQLMNSNVEILQGHTYSITINSIGATQDSYVAIYHDANLASKASFCCVNDEKQLYNLVMKLVAE